MNTVQLRVCHHCDRLSIEVLERLLSRSSLIENVSKCNSCGKNNTRLVFSVTLPQSP